MKTTIIAEWSLISICPAQGPIESAGVLLFERVTDKLLFKLKTDLNTDDEDVNSIWDLLGEALNRRVAEEGADQVVNWLETTWSHVFRVSDLHLLETQDLAEALDSLYEEHVKGQAMTDHQPV